MPTRRVNNVWVNTTNRQVWQKDAESKATALARLKNRNTPPTTDYANLMTWNTRTKKWEEKPEYKYEYYKNGEVKRIYTEASYNKEWTKGNPITTGTYVKEEYKYDQNGKITEHTQRDTYATGRQNNKYEYLGVYDKLTERYTNGKIESRTSQIARWENEEKHAQQIHENRQEAYSDGEIQYKEKRDYDQYGRLTNRDTWNFRTGKYTSQEYNTTKTTYYTPPKQGDPTVQIGSIIYPITQKGNSYSADGGHTWDTNALKAAQTADKSLTNTQKAEIIKKYPIQTETKTTEATDTKDETALNPAIETTGISEELKKYLKGETETNYTMNQKELTQHESQGKETSEKYMPDLITKQVPSYNKEKIYEPTGIAKEVEEGFERFEGGANIADEMALAEIRKIRQPIAEKSLTTIS